MMVCGSGSISGNNSKNQTVGPVQDCNKLRDKDLNMKMYSIHKGRDP